MLRHAESYGNINEFLDPGHKSELTLNGKNTALKLRHNFSNDAIVISSPIIRALETASIIFPNKDMIIDKALSEIDFGDFKYNYKNSFDHSKYIKNKFPNGESYYDLLDRLQSFLSQIEKNDENTYLLVTHGGVICAYLQKYYNVLEDKFPLFKVDYCGFLVIENGKVEKMNGISILN